MSSLDVKNRLTILEKSKIFNDKLNKNEYFYLCSCSCGNTTKVRCGKFNKTIFSCGCLKKELQIDKRLEYGESSFNRIYRTYKKHARERNLAFLLTKEEFKVLTKQNCFYCDKLPNQICKDESSYGEYVYNGVDRLQQEMGYFLENCVSCCWICNRMKGKMNKSEFHEHIKNIYLHSKGEIL